jgi:hypothetical protein
MSCKNCGCGDCHVVYGDLPYDDGDEVSDFECPACGEDLNDNGHCPNEDCEHFECDPFYSADPGIDEQKWERQQMGICG